MLTAPEVYGTRAAAESALWVMADNGRADFTQDGRLRAMVLLATFASLRWGEVTALTRSDADKVITGNIDAHVEAERGRKDDDDGTAGALVPVG
jgi:hypothetical protein